MKGTDQIKLKVCGMKHRDNLDGLVTLQPDFIGFIFYPKSPRYVVDVLSPGDLALVPKTIKKVGVFVNEEAAKVIKIIDEYQLNMVQLHGKETPEFCSEVRGKAQVVKAFSVSEDFDFGMLDQYEGKVDFFLFDTKTPLYGGSGVHFNWNLLKKCNSKTPYFLSGGIGVDDIERIRQLDLKNLFALDVNSRVEVEPGLKDLGMVNELKGKLKS